MDSQKDNKKDITKHEDLYGSSRENYSLFLFKKTEKLVSAIYVITGLFPNDEPLKKFLRHRNLILLDTISRFDLTGSDILNLIRRMSFVISEVVSMLEVGRIGKIISEMNFNVLKEEYLSLAKLLEKRAGAGYSFEDSFFKIQETPRISDKGQNIIKDRGMSFIKKIGPKGESYKGQTVEKTGPEGSALNASAFARKTQSKTSRGALIMKIISEKGAVSVKDISEIIADCSEKTIQRELVDMSSKGLLLKKGDRRWSRYSLPGKS